MSTLKNIKGFASEVFNTFSGKNGESASFYATAGAALIGISACFTQAATLTVTADPVSTGILVLGAGFDLAVGALAIERSFKDAKLHRQKALTL